MLSYADVKAMPSKVINILDSLDDDCVPHFIDDAPTVVIVTNRPQVKSSGRGFEGWGHADLDAWFSQLGKVLP